MSGMREEECFGWECPAATGSEFAAQEYLQWMVRHQRFDVEGLVTEPAGVSRLSWLYEHLRQMCVEVGFYVSAMHAECTEKVCPVMRAGETTYYCAGHGRPRPCSAIGYSVHTLDYAVRQLSSAASFPDRRQVGESSVKHFQAMMRRLYRVFAHAYFHHRDFFERQESATCLYARFVRLARRHDLTPESLIIIPDLPTT
ncbi:hypothetical protein H4R26_004882, partial [Coemansia thaxteri]